MKIEKSSIRFIISLLFIVLIVTAFSITGYIVFTSWRKSARDIAARMEYSMNKNIVNRIDKFLYESLYINETNHFLIENGIVDLYNKEKREMYFAGALKASTSEIYSFTYGTEKGEYYGARKNEKNELELVENNESTERRSRYYSVTENLTSGELISTTDIFDPRTRDWYRIAKENKKPTFSPIYKHFVMNDLTISAVYPIYNQKGALEGVLGTHIILSNINRYLSEIVREKKATAYIVERTSGVVVANSIESANFEILSDGSIKRTRLETVDFKPIITAYEEYVKSSIEKKVVKFNKDKLWTSITSFKKEGLDWIIITAIPESQFTDEIYNSFRFAIILSTIAIFIAIAIYLKGTAIILNPIYSLIKTTERYSQGDFSQRATLHRNDEIGNLSGAFNRMADQLTAFFNTLEEKVKLRTAELEEANAALKKSEGDLRLLMDSTAEAIYGIDLDGNCTFCNSSCIRMLKYEDQTDLIGKNMHSVIHNKRADETPHDKSECKILNGFINGKGTYVEDEVFWRSDGTCFPVEYYSYPQYRDGNIVGGVVTFIDISERKKSKEEILYLSYHDQLTGLYNRRYFEKELKKLDCPANYPLTIVMADMNGLKLVNDSLGHAVGDELLKKVAEVLKRGCRNGDIIARLGGDEFVILLPGTDLKETEQIIKNINEIALQEKVGTVDISISFGYESKKSIEENIQDIFKRAEDYMYKKKLFESPSMRSKTISTIINTFNEKNKREKAHSQRVAELCESLGEALDLPVGDVEELKSVGLLHDIGKIAIDESVLNNSGKLSKEEWEQIKRHPEIGYRILSTVNDMAEMAEYVLAHHERWDGGGYPKGLTGFEIPLQARIIAVADAYDAMISERSYRKAMSEETAVKELEKGAGTQFDPEIIDIFIQKVLRR